MSDEPVAMCPNCGAVAKRLFFPAGIVFKGSGFYKTDNRAASSGGDSKAPAKKESAPKTDTTTKAGSGDAGATSTSTGGS